MTKAEFLERAKAAAERASAASGLPAGITVAQAALESAWGNSRLSQKAHNYFGIKAHGGRAQLELMTQEVMDGQWVNVRAAFAKYASMDECFADRDALMLRLKAYAAARAALPDAEAFARELGKRWATDPGYAEKLLRIYRHNRCNEMDAAKAATDGGAR